MQPLLEAMPVKVILNDKTALIGAARCAVVRSSSVAAELAVSQPQITWLARQAAYSCGRAKMRWRTCGWSRR